MFQRISLVLMLVALCLSQPALAQINPFRGTSATPLNNDDIKALTDATNRLLARPQLAKGNSETWSNPKSGANGTVTAGDVKQSKGMACRVMNYKVTMPSPQAERTRTLTWCKTKDGWKTT